MQGTNVMARFRSKLKKLLLDKSAQRGEAITQRQLAEETKIALSTISRWYRDDDINSLDAETVVKFMDYFECSFDELVAVER